jgi:hypothetical protein
MIGDFWGELAPPLQGTIIGGLLGFLSSSITGVLTVFLGRWLRRSGTLHRQIRAWSGNSLGTISESRSFTLRLLNERDVSTALWNLRIVFYKKGNTLLSRRPKESITKTPIEVLDLPPQVTVSKVFSIAFDVPDESRLGDDLTKVKEADRVEFVADIPGEKKGAFKERLPLWDDLRPPPHTGSEDTL